MEEKKEEINIKDEIEKILKVKGIINEYNFHLCVETDFESYYTWVLFLKFPEMEQYMSKDNRPIMKSSIDSIDDLIKYLEKHGGLEQRWR